MESNSALEQWLRKRGWSPEKIDDEPCKEYFRTVGFPGSYIQFLSEYALAQELYGYPRINTCRDDRVQTIEGREKDIVSRIISHYEDKWQLFAAELAYRIQEKERAFRIMLQYAKNNLREMKDRQYSSFHNPRPTPEDLDIDWFYYKTKKYGKKWNKEKSFIEMKKLEKEFKRYRHNPIDLTKGPAFIAYKSRYEIFLETL